MIRDEASGGNRRPRWSQRLDPHPSHEQGRDGAAVPSLRPTNDDSGTGGPDKDPQSDRSALVNHLLTHHFWRLYLVLVTLLAAVIVFGATTGQHATAWIGAAGTAATGAAVVRRRRR